jgi:hypothetical protein
MKSSYNSIVNQTVSSVLRQTSRRPLHPTKIAYLRLILEVFVQFAAIKVPPAPHSTQLMKQEAGGRMTEEGEQGGVGSLHFDEAVDTAGHQELSVG